MARQLDRVNLFLDGMSRRRRLITTPEGVELEILLANHGERLTAFMLDFFFWLLATILLYLMLILMLVGHLNFVVGMTVIAFLSFLLRNLYFIAFEYRTNGRTPGKRIAGLRVIDQRGASADRRCRSSPATSPARSRSSCRSAPISRCARRAAVRAFGSRPPISAG